MSKMKKQWQTGHFPRGSVVEVQVMGSEPVQFTVVDICQNGIDSWILVSDPFNEAIGFNRSFNIDHVTRIIKRGTGSCKVSRSFQEDWREFHVIPKHPSQYSDYFGSSHVLSNNQPTGD